MEQYFFSKCNTFIHPEPFAPDAQPIMCHNQQIKVTVPSLPKSSMAAINTCNLFLSNFSIHVWGRPRQPTLNVQASLGSASPDFTPAMETLPVA